MTSAIIFDCFGVLTTDAWLPFKERHFGHNQELIDEATSLSKQSDVGMISYGDFIEGVARLAKMPTAQARHEIEDNIANEPLFQYIRQLAKDYKIGFLSNASSNVLTDLFSEDQVSLFDAAAISYEIGYVKPDTRAYQAIADRLDVPLEACIFIDDLERNCTAAQDTGMRAVWYQNFEQAKAEITKILADSKD